MVLQLTAVAIGVILGLPIAMFGFMRLDERPGLTSWTILILGGLITLGPATSVAISHALQTGTGRYEGR